MKTSVASVTFRQKTPEEVAALARRAGLDAVEWGGDVHVPPGDAAAARRALRCTQENGLKVSAYGSYYRAGEGEDFAPVLDTARRLGCRVIRVWAGRQGSAACPPGERLALAGRLAKAAEAAARHGLAVATEYHADTLTDTLASTLALLEAVPGLRTLWQPPIGLTPPENLRALDALAGRVENLHVYHRGPAGDCRPLAEGADAWRAYFAAAQRDGAQRYATLEFVRDGGEAQFLQDAAALHAILGEEGL